MATGALVGLSLSGRVITRFGARRTLLACFVLLTLLLLATILLLWTGLIVAGICTFLIHGFAFSTGDVAANVTGAEAERATGRPRLPLFHAGYSLGGVASTGIGSLAEAMHVPLPLHAAVVLPAALVIALIALRWIPRESEAANDPAAPDTQLLSDVAAVDGPTTVPNASTGATRSPWRDPRIYLLGLIALSMSLAEGTGTDWISLALVDYRGFGNSSAALILAVFFIAMMSTRLAGAPLLERFGRVATIRGSAVLCALGVLAVILVPLGWAAAGGAMLWGMGCALAFPVAISAAADDPARAVKNVAAVSAIAYGAFLLGPMLIGLLGERFGLLQAFWPIAVAALLCVVIAGSTREPKR